MLRSMPQSRTALWPYGNVPYSQNLRWKGLYRQDCSGFLCMLHATPIEGPGTWGGYNTETLVSYGLIREIPASQLKMSDSIGICGAQTGGNAGHIMHFESWYNSIPGDNRCWIWEQAGGISGPRRRLINYPFGAYRSWRWDGIQDDIAPYLHRAWPSYMGRYDYFGDINGPDNSHGGYWPAERPDVAAIQTRLNSIGYPCGIADGIFGRLTIGAVSRWQAALYPQFTTLYGQVWQDDWSRLFTY